MAEPSLKDVLRAIADLRKETKADMADLRKATKGDIAELRVEMTDRFGEMNDRFGEVNDRFGEMNDRFDRVEKQISDLDRDIDGHMKVHRQLEKDIEYLKGRPPRTAARAPRRR